jgi:hypothetical protein
MYPIHSEQFYFSNLTSFSELRSYFETKLSNLIIVPASIKKMTKIKRYLYGMDIAILRIGGGNDEL